MMNEQPLDTSRTTAVKPASPAQSPRPVSNHQTIHSHPLDLQHQKHTLAPNSNEVKPDEIEDELLLKWDDHHRSFFELAEELCHQEQFIDVTLSCGEHNFPAHKLILSVCSPYFRNLFQRNPCKHPIVVLKDVHFKYMKLLLMYMYRGEVFCPHEDLSGLLRTARSLEIRGLVELEQKREAEGLINMTGSPIKRSPSAFIESESTTSMESQEFSIDDVRTRLNGHLEIQPISQPSSSNISNHPEWRSSAEPVSKAAATSSSSSGEPGFTGPTGNGNGSSGNEEDDRPPHHYQKLRKFDDYNKAKWAAADNNGDNNQGTDLSMTARRSPLIQAELPRRRKSRTASSSSNSTATNHAAQLLAAAQAAGVANTTMESLDSMNSVSALLAAAQAHTNNPNSLPASTLASLLPATSSTSPAPSAANSTPPAATGGTSSPGPNGTKPLVEGTNGGHGIQPTNGQGTDLSQAAVVANACNLQLYYYMQKMATAGMGNPKERKECSICGKTLYDRSTWNRHMRIHTGEKPYPCKHCGRRFRTNYNKIGHEKKCPDRLISAADQSTNSKQTTNPNSTSTAAPPPTNNGPRENAVYR